MGYIYAKTQSKACMQCTSHTDKSGCAYSKDHKPSLVRRDPARANTYECNGFVPIGEIPYFTLYPRY